MVPLTVWIHGSFQRSCMDIHMPSPALVSAAGGGGNWFLREPFRLPVSPSQTDRPPQRLRRSFCASEVRSVSADRCVAPKRPTFLTYFMTRTSLAPSGRPRARSQQSLGAECVFMCHDRVLSSNIIITVTDILSLQAKTRLVSSRPDLQSTHISKRMSTL